MVGHDVRAAGEKVFVRICAQNLAEDPAVAVTLLDAAILCFATLFRYNQHFVSTNSDHRRVRARVKAYLVQSCTTKVAAEKSLGSNMGRDSFEALTL